MTRSAARADHPVDRAVVHASAVHRRPPFPPHHRGPIPKPRPRDTAAAGATKPGPRPGRRHRLVSTAHVRGPCDPTVARRPGPGPTRRARPPTRRTVRLRRRKVVPTACTGPGLGHPCACRAHSIGAPTPRPTPHIRPDASAVAMDPYISALLTPHWSPAGPRHHPPCAVSAAREAAQPSQQFLMSSDTHLSSLLKTPGTVGP